MLTQESEREPKVDPPKRESPEPRPEIDPPSREKPIEEPDNKTEQNAESIRFGLGHVELN